jgi:molecular chaperone GrpE
MNQRINIRDDHEQDPDMTLSVDENANLASVPNGETAPESTPADDMNKRLEEAEESARDNYDRLLRISAEFDNYKKRTVREMQDVVKFATEKLARDLLTVVDNLERAIESAGSGRSEEDPLVQGVALTLSEIMKILEKQQVKPIESIGKPFDPALHQAMMTEVAADAPPNTVVRELLKGYTIHDRLLRPAMVSVSTAASVES